MNNHTFCIKITEFTIGIIHYFQHFCKSTESTLGGGSKSMQLYALKMLVLATVPVHETSLANQHFYSTLLGRGRGYVKRVLSVGL